jgi:class 3 adenylate cyclase
MASRTLTVVFTDIKGFTERTAKGSRADLLRMLERHESLLLPLVARYGGRVVKTIGDAFMLVFESPTNAVLCGVMMQQTLKESNADQAPDKQIHIRVAIHTGEVEVVGGDLFGETVNIAARIEGLAEADDVWFSEVTLGAMHRSEVPTAEVGEFRLKGIAQMVRIYKVRFDDEESAFRQILAPESPADSNLVPAPGTFSTNLLYAQEQQQDLSSHSRGSGPWILASAVLLVVAQVGLKGWDKRTDGQAIVAAVALAEGGSGNDAMDQLERLRSERPSDPRIPEALAKAVAADVATLSSEQRFDDALARLDVLEQRLPYLDVFDGLRRDLLLARADHKCLKTSDEMEADHEGLVKRYPKDVEILAHHARCLEHRHNEHDALYLYLDVLELDPSWASDAHLLETVQASIETWSGPRIQKALHEHLFDTVGPTLSEALYAADLERPALRRNAWGTLNLSDPETVDPLRFWCTEFLTRKANDSELRDEMFQWFESQMKAPVSDEVLARIPRIEGDPPILKSHDNKYAERMVTVFSVFFANSHRTKLEQMLERGDVQNRSIRINAMRILKTHDWLTPELEMRYHLSNLQDHDGYVRDHLVESASWFATDSPRNREAIPYLRIVEQEMNAVISRWTEGGSGHQTGPHKALRNTARSGIKRMGG